MRERLISVLEFMIATGDLVEPGQVTHADAYARGTLFPAPPSFAMLTSDVAQIFGVATEGEWAALSDLQGRVVHEGASRRIVAQAGEKIDAQLRIAGLRELSIQSWLKEPPVTSAVAFFDSVKRHLRAAQPGDDLAEDLEVFDSGTKRIYAASWGAPRGKTGLFVVRRPKAFGSTQWMMAEFSSDKVQRVAYLPVPGSSNRGCDEAWCLQLAKDYCVGRPQPFRLRRSSGAAFIDLLFPVPRWAHRRMLVLGTPVPSWRSICSYQVDENLLEETCVFLEQRLWMKRTT